MSDEKKRTVCLLNDSFPPLIDGVANVVVNYAANIEARHGRALVAVPAVPGADDSAFPFPVLRYPSLDTRKLVGYVAGYPFSPETARSVHEAGTELLHVHCPMSSAILARQISEAEKLPLVMTYHTKYDIDIANAIRSKTLQEGAIRALLQNINACDEVWTVSRGAGENLRSLGFEGEYIVMENGVDMPLGSAAPEKISAVTGAYDLPAGVPVFLFVGRLMWYKGLRIILDALAKLKAEGAAFRMVFVGDGGDGEAVRATASELGLDGVCFFTGAVRDREALRAWYSRGDLFLFPSTFDTNGLVVREAAACGTATVMIAGSCAAEGVTDGRNGFCIAENAGALAETLRRLCAAPETMARVGEAAAKELYLSWETAVDRAWERYGAVIENYRAGRYPKRSGVQDLFMRQQGELMEALGKASTLRSRMREELRRLDQERKRISDANQQAFLESFWDDLGRYL